MDQDRDVTSGCSEHKWADIVVRLALVAFILYWSFLLLRPFIATLIWAAILSVALYPFYLWLEHKMGGRATLASFLLTGVALAVILVPVSIIGGVLVNNLASIAVGLSNGTVMIPPPPPYVAEWPLIGEKLASFWETASRQVDQALAAVAPQLTEAVRKLLDIIGNIGIGALQFTVAVVVAGFVYRRATDIQELLQRFAVRVAPSMGAGFIELTSGTVRSVARGVIGISLIQSILFGVGALVANVPLAGLWAFLALVLAIVQIGPSLVIVPVIIYAWVSMETVSATILTVYLVPVMLMDNVLRPIVMGRGLPVPMLVIFIGVIGGTITHGLIGLFVGPIILALGYQLARAWFGAGELASKS